MDEEKLKNILLIDDDIDIQEIVKLALGSIGGFSVEVCSSGAEFLKKVPSIFPQIILLDVMLPNMDGLTIFHKLREIPKFANTPVVFLTAKVQYHEVEKYKNLGAADVISKPFDPMTLSDTVFNIWIKRLT